MHRSFPRLVIAISGCSGIPARIARLRVRPWAGRCCRACVLPAMLAWVSIGCEKPVEPIPMTRIEPDYDRPLPPGERALQKIDRSMYPRFGDAWYLAKGTGLRRSVEQSIDYLRKPSSHSFFPSGEITHDRVLTSLERFLKVLDQADSPEALDRLIGEQFDVYSSVGYDGSGTVLFTGYYSPIFDGSLTRTDRFSVPLYRLPPGFEKDPDGNPIQGRWHTRQEIEAGNLLAGNEIAWLADRFEAYILTVQGSGFVRLPDGTLFEIGYAGHNGYDYTSIGRMLVQDGKIRSDRLSLDSLLRYFHEHPEDLDHYLYQNKRYVFFQEAHGGPFGCLGAPVTTHHSIATDKDIFPRAALAFVDTLIPWQDVRSTRPFRSFVLDQDRGAAIRAPGRCDIYTGVGEQAGRLAGFTYHEGRLYYLFAREDLESAPPIARGTDDDRLP